MKKTSPSNKSTVAKAALTIPASEAAKKPESDLPSVPLAAGNQPYYRSINEYFEWEEDDQGGRTEIAGLPRDDVIESLKRKDQSAAAGDGTIGISFGDVIQKTIGEYMKILEAGNYKDLEDR